MSINLMKLLQDQMGSAVVDQASKFLGESASNTSSGISAMLPSLIGGLMSKGSTESGASGILDMITKGNHDGGILDNIGSVFGGGSSTSNFMNSGSLLTSALFGGSKLGGVLDIVTKATGMRRSSSSSLMNLMAPLVMGMIGKQVKSGGLDAGGLMKMLMGQKDHVASALPAGMGSILGFADMKNSVSEAVTSAGARTASAAKETVREAANVTTDVAKTGASWIRWALPLVALVAIGGWLFSNFGGDKATSMVGDATNSMTEGAKNMGDAATKTVNAAGNAVGNAAGTMTDAAGNVVAGATDAAGNVVTGAVDAAGNAVTGAANAAGNVVAGATDAAGNVVAGAKNVGGKMVDGATNVGGKMVDGAKNAGGKMVDGATNVGGKMVDGAKSAGGAVGGALSAAGKKAQGTFTNMFKSGSSASAYSLNDITFDPTSNKITNYNKDEVMALAASLKANPDTKINIQAFSNAGKNAIANKGIAVTRAKLIQQILTTLGVNAGQMSTSGNAAKDAATANAIQILVK